MKLNTLHAKDCKGKRVLIRADFDVNVERGRIDQPLRIEETVPMIQFVQKHGGCVRLLAHRGRPKGRRKEVFSLKPVANYLAKVLKQSVFFIKNPLDKKSFELWNGSCGIILFENMRFWAEEEENSDQFAQALARWGDCYVNEAFANSHRNHASMVAIPKIVPAYAGLHLVQEIVALIKVMRGPARPLVAVLGGEKLETKLPLIERFLASGASVLVGGALANTLMVAAGYPVGKSVVEFGFVEVVKKIIAHPNLYYPSDVKVARSVHGRVREAAVDDVRADDVIYDIGKDTIARFASALMRAKTIIWNGPLGLAEKKKFSGGTQAMARALARAHAYTVVGGGDTVALLKKYHLLEGFSHVSTGGGAMLEFLSGKHLPAIAILEK